MKVIVEKSKKEVKLGDLVISSSTGREFIVSEKLNGKYTLYELKEAMFVESEYHSIESMMENFFTSFVHYPKETLELYVKVGKK